MPMNLTIDPGIKMTDKDTAIDMLTASKATIKSLVAAAAEATNPQLRQMLNGHITACVNEHHRLSDIAISKGWYKAFDNPLQQLQQDVCAANDVIR